LGRIIFLLRVISRWFRDLKFSVLWFKFDFMTENKYYWIWLLIQCQLSIFNDKHGRWLKIHQQWELDLAISWNSITSVFR
jgi:hypothetical protein